MPRKPLGDRALTAAERQARRRGARAEQAARMEYALRRIVEAAHTPFPTDFDRSLAMVTIAKKALDGSLAVSVQ